MTRMSVYTSFSVADEPPPGGFPVIVPEVRFQSFFCGCGLCYCASVLCFVCLRALLCELGFGWTWGTIMIGRSGDVQRIVGMVEGKGECGLNFGMVSGWNSRRCWKLGVYEAGVEERGSG